MYAPHALQVLECAVLLTSCQPLHSKQRATWTFGLLAKMPSIFPSNPAPPSSALGGGEAGWSGLWLENPVTAGELSARGALGRDQLLTAGAGAALAEPEGASPRVDGVMAKYSLHRRQKVDLASDGSCC